jgi:hypothetical protein
MHQIVTPLPFPPPLLHMFNSEDELEMIVRILFSLLLFIIPSRCHKFFFSFSLLCYVKFELPHLENGALNLSILGTSHWGLLPIQDLWSHILNDPVVGGMLREHCSELSYKQILWVAHNDPDNRARLLQDDPCMRQVNWGQAPIDLDDYQNHLTELPIHSLTSHLNFIPAGVILHGLERCNFQFPSTRHLCQFLHRCPSHIFQELDTFSDVDVINLFDANCLIDDNSPANNNVFLHLSDLLLAKSSSLAHDPRWIFKMAELKDFFTTFPQYKTKFPLQAQSVAAIEFPFPGSALQSRTLALQPDGYTLDFPITGPFDQFRLLQIILPDRFDLLAEFWDDGLFEFWVFRKFMSLNPSIQRILHQHKHQGPKLLRLLSLRSCLDQRSENEQHHESIVRSRGSSSSPLVLPKPENIKSLRQLELEIVSLFSKPATIESFSHPSFRIKFVDDAVVDLGGPLLDWISRILQLFLDFGAFRMESDEGDSCKFGNCQAQSQSFLNPSLFKFIGLLHGKLLQLESGPNWIPVIGNDRRRQELLKLAMSKPEEAITLFNDFGFAPRAFCVKTIREIFELTGSFEAQFRIWERRALNEYSAGLKHFILDDVSELTIRELLTPPTHPITPAAILEATSIHSNDALNQKFPLSQIWYRALSHFTSAELVKLLIFITGQTRIRNISLHFVDLPTQRLAQSKTCYNQLFLYISTEETTSEADLVANIAKNLRFSLLNYQGFGNA